MVIQKKILKLRYIVDISSKNGDMYGVFYEFGWFVSLFLTPIAIYLYDFAEHINNLALFKQDKINFQVITLQPTVRFSRQLYHKTWFCIGPK